MSETWYDQLGYSYNPFTLDPMKFEDDLLVGMGDEAKELLTRIKSGNIVFIEGESGSGKTMLLKHAIDNFKGRGKVIYIDARKINKQLNIESLLVNRYGIIKGRMLKKKPKHMILLIDNIEELSKTNTERLKYFFDQDYLKSVVMTAEDYNSVNFHDSLRERIGSRVIKINSMNEDEAVEMIHDRLGDEDIISAKLVKKIFVKSGKNPAQTLINAYKACDIAVKDGEEVVQEKHIEEALKDKEPVADLVEELPDTEVCEDCGTALVKIGEYWRCPECDIYCGGCGASVDPDDKECPECKGIFEN